MEDVIYKVYSKRPRLYGFSCPHYGDGEARHDADLWGEFLDDVERTPGAVVFGLGDYLDFTRTTYRFSMRSTWGEDDNTHQEVDAMVTKTFVEPFVWGIRKRAPSMLPKGKQPGKLVGLVEGNHFYRYLNGQTSTQKICELLGVPYLGLSAWVRLTVYRSLGRKKAGAGHNLNVLLNHSVSSAGNLPASLAAAMRKVQGWRGVDVFLSANDHQLGQTVEQQIGRTQAGRLRQVQFQTVVGKCGSFQKGYIQGACANSYVEKKFLHPSRLGYLAFDAWIHHASIYRDAEERRTGRGSDSTPEVWRYGNFTA